MLIEKDSVKVSYKKDIRKERTIFSVSLTDLLMRDLASEAPSLIINKIVEEQAKYIEENFQKEIMESIDFKAIGDEVIHKLADDFIKKFKESCIKEMEAKVNEVMEGDK